MPNTWLWSGIALICAVYLSACGGGGSAPGGGAGTSSIADEGPTHTVAITQSNDVPNITKTAISQTVSPFGLLNGASGILDVANVGDAAESMVLQLDSKQNPILISIGTGDIAIGVRSTAISLVRIASNTIRVPDGMSSAQLELSIVDSQYFQLLQNSINSALLSGLSPIDSPDVVDYATAIAGDISRQIQAGGMVAAAQSPRSFLASAPGMPAGPLPYYFWDNSNTDKLWLTDLSGDNVQLNNRTFLAWSVKSKHIGGDVLYEGSIDPLSGARTIFGVYGGTEAIKQIASRGKFTITVLQDTNSRLQNSISGVHKLIFTVVDAVLLGAGVDLSAEEKCIKDVSSTLIDNSALSKIAGEQTADSFVLYAKSILGKLSARAITGCSLTVDFKSALNLFFPTWKRLWAALSLADKGFATGSIGYQLVSNWNTNQSAALCKINGLTVLCPTLNLSPAALSILPGASSAIQAVEANPRGDQVISPAIKWSSSTPGVSVDSNGVVTANGDFLGEVVIDAEDSNYGNKASINVSVINAPLYASLSSAIPVLDAVQWAETAQDIGCKNAGDSYAQTRTMQIDFIGAIANLSISRANGEWVANSYTWAGTSVLGALDMYTGVALKTTNSISIDSSGIINYAEVGVPSVAVLEYSYVGTVDMGGGAYHSHLHEIATGYGSACPNQISDSSIDRSGLLPLTAAY